MLTVILPITRHGATVDWAFIDEDIAQALRGKCLRMGSHGYAIIVGTRTLLHRFVMGLEPGDGRVVDHISRRKYDYTRKNLRVCTQADNMQNLERSPHCGTTRMRDKWQAHAKNNGQHVYLGTYTSREVAAAVAREYRKQHYAFSDESG